MKVLLFAFTLLMCNQLVNAQTHDTIYVKFDDINLHTVISSPKEKAEALAIFIVGSGPTDLNGNQPMMTNNSIQYLADELLFQGIATVRFDKRGVGKSKSQNYDETKLTIDRFAKDLEALIDFYKKRTNKKIYLVGHSQGSLIGLIAAQHVSVDGFISIAGAGNSIDLVLKKQLKPKLPAPYFAQAENIVDSLKNGNAVKIIPPHLQQAFRPSVQSYMISWMQYNPTELIRKLHCNSLIVQGNNDIQVDLEEAQVLSGACVKAELLVINKMNHVLKTVEGDMQQNLATYSDPSLPVNQEMVQGIVKFIHNN